jgi:hypothetical protein
LADERDAERPRAQGQKWRIGSSALVGDLTRHAAERAIRLPRCLVRILEDFSVARRMAVACGA